jgi:broad specificity phosphatase PhoE
MTPPAYRSLFLGLALAIPACTTAPAAASVASAPGAAAAQSALIVYLVRHAEKADTTSDPSLSVGGVARAAALREALRDAGVTAIIVSNRRRTQETAEPLAGLLGLTQLIVPVGGGIGGHASAVAQAVRAHRGSSTLVVGHSNTVPAIIRALGGPAVPDICDPQYANLYVLVLAPGEPTRLARTSYGAPDPADAACAAMQMRE